MILVLSPSKTLDFSGKPRIAEYTQPEMLSESQLLVKELRRYSPAKISKLMDISDRLAALNVQRYKDFKMPFTPANARQAILAFKGDVYEGIDVENYKKEDFTFAQKQLRILSGLYGLLRPLDLMQPYRLEMSIPLPNPRGKNLYGFWADRITHALNRALVEGKSKLLVNLASEEYFKVVNPKTLEGELLHIVFKEKKQGALKIVGLFAKQARGRMADFIVKQRINDKKELKNFTGGGYRFAPELSAAQQYIFVR